ncbi:23S rRNA (uracil(1939)-C(5))-methyltransferase RlmD [Isachenkonia alkalipeptolytica]|uniref:23S rRNA (Uracil(1939)-C(5))-methyltransferase RlmD n=1 Tax=Isachenkonia alkalipeptolytica TaxID=2565777 RepID=A0AA43XI79_9CLOT|nr:23S rRNA (uracil(1939)-C(5))-methyltransferase RlmD [Isachenkonia alkalipeptolytica]NBG87303.1 23S rRNA (uracil(1939)-C(5))-methyltransferase RlmD [Isachenkonia alkalipeptolytica]
MLKKNGIYTVTIEDIGHKGEGVGKVKGIPLFIQGGLPGDELKVEVTKLKKNYGFAKLLDIQKPSDQRVIPRCPIAEVCGGCQIMSLDYSEQLNIKTRRVRETLQRLGKIDAPVHAAMGMKEPYHYRNKAQFPVGMEGNTPVMGFFKTGTHEIVNTEHCYIQHPVNDVLTKIVKEYIGKYSVTVYDEKSRQGLLRHMVSRVSNKTGEVMVIFVINGKELPYKEELIRELKKEVKNLKTVVQNINTKNTNVIFGEKTATLYGEGYIVDQLMDLSFYISPRSFFQVNPTQTQVLYQKALDYADLKREETVFDLYCGIGSISLFLAQQAKKVYGIEIVPEAIEDAKKNGELNNLSNTEFLLGAAEDVVPKLYEKGITADVVVVDPPRKGCEETVLETMVKMDPKKIVYVSCNPSTLARDLAYLEERGYQTKEVQPVDLFPHTSHVECVALMYKRGKIVP